MQHISPLQPLPSYSKGASHEERATGFAQFNRSSLGVIPSYVMPGSHLRCGDANRDS